MQNRYAGDIGDYGKLGLLRSLSRTGLSIGVNWYLTPDEHHNGDGRFTAYLLDDSYRSLDEELFFSLQKIVSTDNRSVSALEQAGLLEAAFYHEPLDFRGAADRVAVRERWHSEALGCLAGRDLVFLDPDNGLMVKSAERTIRANKYVTLKEIADYCWNGTSVIWYQHKAREKDLFYSNQFREICERPEFRGMTGLGLKFVPVSQRYYFFLICPEHREFLSGWAETFLNSPWKSCFSIL